MSRLRDPKHKGFPPNLYINSAGYFFYRNTLNGKTKGLGRDKANAFREARNANAVVATQAPSPLVDWVSGVKQHTLKEWVPLYKELWIGKKKPAEQTLRMQLTYLDRIANAEFSWMELKAVTTAHVAKFVDAVEQESGAATAGFIRSRLSDVFKMAISKGEVADGKNPVDSTYRPAYEVKRDRLSLEQYHAVREVAQPWLVDAMDLALLTAQRREEIAGAMFADFRDGFIYFVPGKMQGKVRLQQDASIGLAVVNRTIADVIKQCRNRAVSQFMVHHQKRHATAKPGDGLSVAAITHAFSTAYKKAKVVPTVGRTPASFHEIRSLSERLYRDQYGPEFAQAMLGHKNATMTAEYDDLRGSGWQVISAK